MMITNGHITRNIAAEQLPEYEAKGYAVVKTTAKPKAEPKPKKAGAK
ncbi:MAG: hypothetical protein J6U87_05480 [Clostridia bacterium]|nr:hypothetical protein [Clostridia bacterium]